ncbi:hypothetical protein [uncultured Thiodictyon sp.]|uniref:hypothetical protein n=1 Tax=uncultured Thiodictyon sp. TaxID=1846217 RepID=UPI0025DC26BA|nr:hypothetical protein [uncultured Thiodictyon sp.]
MALFANLFSKSGKREEQPVGRNRQLPSHLVAKEFGEVDVRRLGHQHEVFFSILMEPVGAEAEGWQTGVAMDASVSMQGLFGNHLVAGPQGRLPKDVAAHYERNGWIKHVEKDGQRLRIFSAEAWNDALSRGYVARSQNEVEAKARDFTRYLAENLDADGGTTVIYWACGDGSQIEELGDLTGADCEHAQFHGPVAHGFGQRTVLLPAVEYFVKRFAAARRGMYIFITDGRLDDLDAVKGYTVTLCEDIAAGRRNPVKCVLIGVGSQIDERQMEELDDLESGTDVDVWDHKIAKDMRVLTEIFAEVVSEHQIVAPTARIYDSRGAVVKNFADGLPARVTFNLSADSHWFELEVAGRRIKQMLVES